MRSQLDLLDRLGSGLMVPQAVVDEILAGPGDDPARKAIEAGWGTRASQCDIPEGVQEWGLGAGESAVIALAAVRPGAVALLDDAQGRACARSLGIPIIGSLGVILLGRRRGLVPSLERAVEDLRRAGLYLDPSLVTMLLEHERKQ